MDSISERQRSVERQARLPVHNLDWRAMHNMANQKQRDALRVIGRHLKSQLDQDAPKPQPDIERALRRLLERDVAERLRPNRRWAGRDR